MADVAVSQVLTVGVALAVVAVTVQTAGHLAYFGLLDSDVGQLNADAEESVWSWASTAVTFAAAFASLLLAAVEPARAGGRLLLAGLLGLFSLDDAVRLHEDYGEEFTEHVLGLGESAAHAVWPALFGPLLALALLLLLRESRLAEPRVARLLVAGCALLVGAVGLEATASFLDAETWPGAIEIAFEEGAELGGWLLIAAALAARFLQPGGREA